MKDGWTTLSIKKDTKEELRELKVHPNQSFNELIENILEEMDE